MCGRYVSPDDAAIERAWHIGARGPLPFVTRYNTAPTAIVPILVAGGADAYQLLPARWGFVPFWWKQPKPPAATINARLEEAAVKPMWRDAFRRSRCIVPAIGWYEWQVLEQVDPETGEVRTVKQPHFITLADRAAAGFAGLLSTTRQPNGEPLTTCAIMTTAAADSVAGVHDRMPVVLPPELQRQWVDPQITDAGAVAQMASHARRDLRHHPVASRVNSARNEDAGLIEPLPLRGGSEE